MSNIDTSKVSSPVLDARYIQHIDRIKQTRRNRLVAIMLCVFGDESSDEKNQRVFAVSGIVGTQEEWDALAPVWLERTGGKILHAADCEADRGAYKGIPHKENQKLYADLVNIIARTNFIGFAAVVDLQDHKEFFPNVVENIPYHFCFSEVVMKFAEIAYLHIPQQKVKFTFDMNTKTCASSVVLYEYLRNSPGWKYADLIDEISFAGRNNIGIQAADIIAREAMKHYDNFFVGPVKRPERISMQVLSSTERYSFLYVNRNYFTKLKYAMEMENVSVGYHKWLLENKLADNVFNRNRYLPLLESIIISKAKKKINQE